MCYVHAHSCPPFLCFLSSCLVIAHPLAHKTIHSAKMQKRQDWIYQNMWACTLTHTKTHKEANMWKAAQIRSWTERTSNQIIGKVCRRTWEQITMKSEIKPRLLPSQCALSEGTCLQHETCWLQSVREGKITYTKSQMAIQDLPDPFFRSKGQ